MVCGAALLRWRVSVDSSAASACWVTSRACSVRFRLCARASRARLSASLSSPAQAARLVVQPLAALSATQRGFGVGCACWRAQIALTVSRLAAGQVFSASSAWRKPRRPARRRLRHRGPGRLLRRPAGLSELVFQRSISSLSWRSCWLSPASSWRTPSRSRCRRLAVSRRWRCCSSSRASCALASALSAWRWCTGVGGGKCASWAASAGRPVQRPGCSCLPARLPARQLERLGLGSVGRSRRRAMASRFCLWSARRAGRDIAGRLRPAPAVFGLPLQLLANVFDAGEAVAGVGEARLVSGGALCSATRRRLLPGRRSSSGAPR